MALFDRFRRQASGGPAGVRARLEGAMSRRRLRGWNPPLENINALVASGGSKLLARARELVVTNGYAANACQAFAANVVGEALRALQRVDHAERRRAGQRGLGRDHLCQGTRTPGGAGLGRHRRRGRQSHRAQPGGHRRAPRHLADLRGVPADLSLQGSAAGAGKKRLHALAAWEFGGGARSCEGCESSDANPQSCQDCPARLNRPRTHEGWQVWDLVGRLGGQLRVLPNAVIGWDMTAALALGTALGVPPLAMAELLPGIEAVMVVKLNEQMPSGSLKGCDA